MDQEELNILKGLFIDQYVSVLMKTQELDSTGKLVPGMRVGFVHEITPTFIVMTDTEGDVIDPYVIFRDQIASIGILPETMVSEIQFELAEKAHGSARVYPTVDPKDTKIN